MNECFRKYGFVSRLLDLILILFAMCLVQIISLECFCYLNAGKLLWTY